MNTIREIQKINDQELELGIAGTPASWHQKYLKCSWVYVGNLDYALTEGDVICVLSQCGEIEDLHLVRDDMTGKSKGFAFCKYEDSRSCVLAVDNLCGVQICGRSIRVDHVENYRLPKHLQDDGKDGSTITHVGPGHAYQGQELASSYSLSQGQDLFAKRQNLSGRSDAQQTTESSSKTERHSKKEGEARRKRDREEKRREREAKKRAKKHHKKSSKSERRSKGKARERQSSSDDDYDDDSSRS